MADDVRITNLPDSGSPERVAYDLAFLILRTASPVDYSQTRVLDTFADCLKVVRGGGYKLSEL
jgi:hypothetical protein